MNIVVIITSKACGFCVRLKQGKERFPGGHLWGPEFFRKVTATGKWKLYLVNFDAGQRPTGTHLVSSVTEWSVLGSITYEAEGKRCYAVNPSGSRQYLSMEWSTWMATLIPEDILRLIMVWPTIGYFSAENWYAALAKTRPLYGYFPPMQVGLNEEGKYYPVSIPANFKHEDPVMVMASIDTDPKPLNPVQSSIRPTDDIGYRIFASR